MRKLLPLVWMLWCACEPVSPPPLDAPHILSITPAEQDSITAQVVTVLLDQDPRFQVDYGEGSASKLDVPVLWVGPWKVPLDAYLGHGRFQGTVPPGLDAGRYDIRVTLEDGREASLQDAYQINPSVGFWVEPIIDQVQDQPFTVTLHAAGPSSGLFMGTVTMTLYSMGGTLAETRHTGAFSGGVRQEQLTISTPGSNYLVRVDDGAGHTASSNAFQVTPPMVGFWVESIGDQVQDQPFTVTFHAAGPGADSFVGTVTMTLYSMGGTPAQTRRTSAFSAGVRQEELTISTPGSNYLVVIDDGAGHTASSGAFQVVPKS